MKSAFPIKLSLTILAGCMLSAGAIGAQTLANDPATLARIRDSAIRVGIASRKVTRNTDRLDSRYPAVPITAAATPLPNSALMLAE